MHSSLKTAAVALVICGLAVVTASGQHSFQNTRTVDPSGNADETTIQDAIDFFGNNPANKKTVLIYAGTYAEGVALDGTQENIDLVGVDRDAVIIAPSSGDGIVITSGTETSRNNSIRNLTVRTTDGDAIRIARGRGERDEPPGDIVIENVNIEVDGTDRCGIRATTTHGLRIAGCEVTAQAGHGVCIGEEDADCVHCRRSRDSLRAPLDVPGTVVLWDPIAFAHRVLEQHPASSDLLLHDLTVRTRSDSHAALRIYGARGLPDARALRIVDLLVFDSKNLVTVTDGPGSRAADHARATSSTR